MPASSLPGNENDEGQVSSDSVPIIDLTPSRKIIRRLFRSSKCRRCEWNGNPRELVAHGRKSFRETNPISPLECASCQLLSSAMQQLRNRVCETDSAKSSFIRKIYSGGYDYYIYEDNHTNIWSVFTTLDLRGTKFERCRIPTRPWICVDSLLKASAQWALRQISVCLQSHQLCRRSQRDDSFLPARLINVGVKNLGQDVVLENRTSVPPGSLYAAFSYCWGTHKPECMTTPDTVGKNMKRIPWSTLPATFQDAVSFARSLGLKYLWIDSMCIIQGDIDDWTHQAGQMYHVYRNAHVTLAAVYGHSSTSGLRSMSTESQSVRVAELRLGQDHCPIYMRPSHFLRHGWGDHSQAYPGVKDWAPLFCRAWAFQERLISPRVLYFTESEILFQCFSATACECGLCNVLNDAKSLRYFDKTRFFTVAVANGENRNNHSRDDISSWID
ncbi:heterokaryon incompatibility protein-domain-containing protein [Hypoxylon crocopeplum]|nr:heterokaryon incompatibility protein-domain-containing protein [Hypoxylon crocopeplum]